MATLKENIQYFTVINKIFVVIVVLYWYQIGFPMKKKEKKKNV